MKLPTTSEEFKRNIGNALSFVHNDIKTIKNKKKCIEILREILNIKTNIYLKEIYIEMFVPAILSIYDFKIDKYRYIDKSENEIFEILNKLPTIYKRYCGDSYINTTKLYIDELVKRKLYIRYDLINYYPHIKLLFGPNYEINRISMFANKNIWFDKYFSIPIIDLYLFNSHKHYKYYKKIIYKYNFFNVYYNS